jgi:hypothetical protein
MEVPKMITHAVLIGVDLGPGARGAEDFEMSDAGQKRPVSDVRITSAFPPVATE